MGCILHRISRYAFEVSVSARRWIGIYKLPSTSASLLPSLSHCVLAFLQNLSWNWPWCVASCAVSQHRNIGSPCALLKNDQEERSMVWRPVCLKISSGHSHVPFCFLVRSKTRNAGETCLCYFKTPMFIYELCSRRSYTEETGAK
jgi:hypothetical protein